MELTAMNVDKIFKDCLFKSNPSEGTEYLFGDGIVLQVGFNPEAIEQHAGDIKELLDNLPGAFKEGASFIGFCFDKGGNQWGEHRSGDQLVCLGIASGWLSYCTPREVWEFVPGGVPYIIVHSERNIVEKKVV